MIDTTKLRELEQVAPVPREFEVIRLDGKSVSEDERKKLFEMFDATIDRFLENDND